MTDRYAVVGFPVTHSRSPFIHERFAKQTSQDISYDRIDCEPASFARTVTAFFDAGGRGLNVTAPHKQAAFVLADTVGMRARIAGAVNTLSPSAEGGLVGDNTDGTGLLRDLLVNLGLTLAGSRILLLGAGGAARGIAAPLLGQAPAGLTVANRTFERAVELVETIAGFGNVRARPLDSLAGENFDLIVNATAAGLDDEALQLDVDATASVCYDLTYAAQPTAFMRWARAAGARRVHDGWGMLVEQAAESFYLWRRVWPQTRPVIDARPF